MPNYGGMDLTGLKEAPKSRNRKLGCKGLGKQGTSQQGLLPKTVAIRQKLKCIYPCEGRGTTDEPPVMGVEEQPQV
jgi:hypothetical protein